MYVNIQESFDDLTELVEFLEDILNDLLSELVNKLADKLVMLNYSELRDNLLEKDALNLFEDIVKINKEIEQCKFILETENSAPC